MRQSAILGNLIILCLGCSSQSGPTYQGDQVPVHPVSGQVTLGGQPLQDARLFFHAVDSSQSIQLRPRAFAEADGSFQVTTYSANDGAPAGKYTVTVSWLGPLDGVKEDDEDLLPERLPRRYQNPSQSGIEIEVVEGENQLPPFELKR